MDSVTKSLLIFGGLFFVAAILWHFGLIQNLKLGRLPGDIYVDKRNVKFYFPITTGILISVVISLILRFFKN